jgi:dihydroorotate dehydrogenase (fumarate)
MNLTTQYLGLSLANPLVVGASPFCDSVQTARELQDAGAAAVVMRSLFEEQIEAEIRALAHQVESPSDSYAEATSYFPNFSEYQLAPDQYLRQIEALKGRSRSRSSPRSTAPGRAGGSTSRGALRRRAPTRSSSTSTSW